MVHTQVNPAALSGNCRIWSCQQSGTEEGGAGVIPVCLREEKSDLQGSAGIKSIGRSFLAISSGARNCSGFVPALSHSCSTGASFPVEIGVALWALGAEP